VDKDLFFGKYAGPVVTHVQGIKKAFRGDAIYAGKSKLELHQRRRLEPPALKMLHLLPLKIIIILCRSK
jgi:hypothetical protein